MTRSPSYLSQNRFGHCFRIRVPKDLQIPFARKELRYSLKTGNLPEAKAKARLLAGQVQQIFKWLRTGYSRQINLPDSRINELVKRFLRGLIDDYDKPTAHRTYAEDHERAPFCDQDGLEEALECMNEIRDDLNLKLQSGNFKIAERKADKLLAEEGIILDVDKKSQAYWKLCSGILRAMIKGVDYKKQRMVGEYTDKLEDVLESCLQRNDKPVQSESVDEETVSTGWVGMPHSTAAIETEPASESTVELSISLFELISEYTKEKVDLGDWDDGTVRNHNSKIKAMLQMFGKETQVSQITVEDVRQYTKLLELLPPGFCSTQSLQRYGSSLFHVGKSKSSLPAIR